MNSDDLKQTVYEIRNRVINNISTNNVYPEFKKMYPKLWDMLHDPKCDPYMVEKMIHCFALRTSTDEKTNDEMFGTYAVKKYVSHLSNKE